MGQRRPTRGAVIFLVVAGVLGLAATIALLYFGAQGAQIANIIAPYFGLLALMAALYPQFPQRPSKAKSSNQHPSRFRNASETNLFSALQRAVRNHSVI